MIEQNFKIRSKRSKANKHSLAGKIREALSIKERMTLEELILMLETFYDYKIGNIAVKKTRLLHALWRLENQSHHIVKEVIEGMSLYRLNTKIYKKK